MKPSSRTAASAMAVAIGRVLVSAIFLGAGIDKLRNPEKSLAYMTSKGLQKSRGLLTLAALTEITLAPGILLGYKPRASAALLALYLVPVTLTMHRFWELEGQERELEQVNFLKNLAIIGGLIEISAQKRAPLRVESIVPRALREAA